MRHGPHVPPGTCLLPDVYSMLPPSSHPTERPPVRCHLAVLPGAARGADAVSAVQACCCLSPGLLPCRLPAGDACAQAAFGKRPLRSSSFLLLSHTRVLNRMQFSGSLAHS